MTLSQEAQREEWKQCRSRFWGMPAIEIMTEVHNLLPMADDPDWITRPEDLACDVDRAKGLLSDWARINFQLELEDKS